MSGLARRNCRARSAWLALVGIALALLSASAVAESSPGWMELLSLMKLTVPPDPVSLTDKTAEVVNAAVKTLTTIFSSGARDLRPAGKGILVALATLSMGWIGVKVAAGALELPAAMAEIVKVAAITGLAYVAIQPVEVFKPFIGDRTLGQFIGSGFSWIVSSAGNPIGENVGAFKNAITVLWNLPIIPKQLSGAGTFVFIIGQLDTILVVIALKVIASALLVIACIVTLGHLLVAQIQIDLTLYLTPLLVPWLLFRPLSFLFNSWLKSLIAGGLLLMIGQLFAYAGSVFVNALGATLPSGATGSEYYYLGEQVLVVYLGVVFAAGMFILVAMKLDNLTSALLGGGLASGIGLREFGNAMRMAGGPAGMASGAAKGAARMTASTAAGMSAVKAAAGARAETAAATKTSNAFGSLGGVAKPMTAPPMTAMQKVAAFREGSRAFAASRRSGSGLGASMEAARSAGAVSGQSSMTPKSTGAPTPFSPAAAAQQAPKRTRT